MPKGKKKKEAAEEVEVVEKKSSPFQKEIQFLIVLVIAIIFMLGYMNLAGIVGKMLSYLAFGLCGVLAYILPIFVVGMLLFYMANKDNRLLVKKMICVCVMGVLMMALLQLVTYHFDGFDIVRLVRQSAVNRAGGGLIGILIGCLLAYCFGELGAYVILAALFAVGFMFLTEKLLFHSLKRKSKVAYDRIKERAEIAALERAEEREREEDLAELENWEDDRKRLRLPFFNFKKESEVIIDAEEQEIKPVEEEELIPEKTETASEEMVEETRSEEPEAYPNIVIHREEQEPEKEAVDDIPIHQQELLQKFSDMEEVLPDEDTAFMEDMEEGLQEFASAFAPEKEEGEGVVLDAMETAQEQNPDDVISQLSQTGQKENVQPQRQVKSQETSAPSAQSQSEPQPQPVVKTTPAKKKKKKYVFPTAALLTKSGQEKQTVSKDSLMSKAKKLQDTLESFGVGARVTDVCCGPSVTRFELQPNQGVKVSKITALADDIKLNMAAEEIRIEAPIPGKAAVGIEVPNEETSMVHLRDLVENTKFKGHKSKIAFAVGKDISGQVIVTDIAKMPHLLIAGATGSGNSVCINTLIMSILYKATPEEVKLIMIDPKVVELSCYNGIPHLLLPVVTDPKKAAGALQWAVQEMTERYKKFADLGVREINGYNQRIKSVENAEDERYQKMPQIVIIVDELADLMMVASKEVEDSICRLAQLARAAGIHLVIATQRPSVNVITGLIKANVPSRIAFAVSSAVDSRTILDGSGAEKLLGKGDMLFYPAGFPKPVRVQGAFVSDEEVNAVVEFIKEHNEVDESSVDTSVEEKINVASTLGKEDEKGDSSHDAYFAEAGKFIIEKNKASIGMLQRVYKIGFNRAARIMDQLCAAGVVGPEEGTKPRKVLMSLEEFDQYLAG